jgi:LmbE family N-acetylglucosaminyl deacetylase
VASLPDGRVAHLPLEEGAVPIREVLDAFAPQVVITHDARGVNAHPDHIAVHWLMRHALVGREATRLAMVAYTQEASEAASPRLLFPTAEADIDARLHLSASEIAAKEACLRVHEALVTISEGGPADLIRRPPIENYAFLGESRSASLEACGEDLFRNPLPL